VIEIMFQGMGGHGSVVAAKLLAQAAAKSGFQSQSFASYGALRRGGKVEGYVRISDEQIVLRCKMYSPDYLVVMDDALIDDSGTPGGLKENGTILVNTSKTKSAYPSLEKYHVYTVDAYGIAAEKGLIIPGGMPVINTTLLGALVGIMKTIPIENLVDVITANTPKPEKNADCARDGYQAVLSATGDTAPGEGSETDGTPAKASFKRTPVHLPEKMSKCHRCQICYMVCPTLAISFEGKEDPLSYFVNEELCNACGICIQECPRDAISWEGE